eukprot:COSAG06_NODE_54829_length_292_cov_1.352332_1_plen_78_part_01
MAARCLVELQVPESQAEVFEQNFVRAGKMDAGELNPQSKWQKESHEGRAYFYHPDSKVLTLKVPAEGITDDLLVPESK